MFFKKNGERVFSKDSMDYIRVVNGPLEGSKLYNATEYYRSGKPKIAGQSSGINPVIWEGVNTAYWPNGNIRSTSTFKHNKIIGDRSEFFSNGKLHTIMTYDSVETNKADTSLHPSVPYIKTCNDSTGKALLVNGNGYFIDYDSNSSKISLEGNVKDGKKVGEWKGSYEKESLTFIETYDDNGNLISGTSIDSEGTYSYKKQSVSAQYKGGIKEFYNYLARTIRYPSKARENNTRGKVILSFIVNKSGKVEDIKVLQTVSPEIDKEAIRVVGLSSNWQPGIAFGRAVKQLYTLPISFNLMGQTSPLY